MISAALILSIIISTASFAWGYWTAGYQDIARWIILFGAAWVASHWRRWKLFPTPAIFISLLLAAFGVWFELHYGWMFSGAAFALIAYDLGEFQLRMKMLPAREDIRGRTRRRILRISFLVGVGLALVTLLISFIGQLTREWGLFLVVVALLGSLQIFAWLNR
jgi:hypothetical protein